ncbi:MAG: hypothetical protein LBS74_07020 [Oscillospiraceae bacterium]|jgi:hypothetical protein|nr:hypothetical protein [Oscillospiraceae bacterium]
MNQKPIALWEYHPINKSFKLSAQDLEIECGSLEEGLKAAPEGLELQMKQPTASDVCWLIEKPTLRLPAFLILLKENIIAAVLLLTALIIFVCSPYNAQGMGYISIVMTGFLFTILAVTAVISNLKDYLSIPNDYAAALGKSLIYYRSKTVLDSLISSEHRTLHLFYAVERLEAVKYSKLCIQLQGSFTVQVLDSNGVPLEEKQLSKLNLPASFGNLDSLADYLKILTIKQ